MKYYLVYVWAWSPYKREKEYRIERSSYGAAISEAVKRFRKDIGRHKLDEIFVKARYICSKQQTGA